MKKKLILLFAIISILASCSHRNEFGQNRVGFNIEKIKPNKDESVYKIIDTSKIYQQIALTDNLRNPVATQHGRKKYLKFYKNGRVAEFTDIDLQNIESYNPKRAESNLYALRNGKLVVQTYFKNPQCGLCFIKNKLDKISEDTFELNNGEYISTYKALEIPKSFLIYKPDW